MYNTSELVDKFIEIENLLNCLLYLGPTQHEYQSLSQYCPLKNEH